METQQYAVYQGQRRVEIFDDTPGYLDLRKVENLTEENSRNQNRCDACKCRLQVICFITVIGGIAGALAYLSHCFPYHCDY